MKFNFNSALMLLDILPGQKRTVTAIFALGMLACQMFGFHVFTPSEWAGVGVTGLIFNHMGVIRKNEEKV